MDVRRPEYLKMTPNTAPETATYRVRFRFRVQVKLNISDPEYRFKIADKDAVLSSPVTEMPIRESEWLHLNVRGFETQAEAVPASTDGTGAGVGSLGIGSLKGHDA